MPLSDDQIAQRLREDKNLWLATVRPAGAPHLVPVWFVTHNDLLYLCTSPNSVKARNLGANPRIACALEDGSAPIILEGTAHLLELAQTPPAVVSLFKAKYDWDILTDTTYTIVVVIKPERRLNW